MGIDQQTDTRKDKRLLVLLAFGVLIHLARISGQVIPDRSMAQHSWGWVEYAGKGNGLQRVLLADGQHEEIIPDFSQREKGNPGELPEILRRHGAITVPAGGERNTLSPTVSPRLAFLLGRPIPVNRASFDELILLHEVGPKLAASIVDYRDRYGRIGDAQELRAVPGIGKILAARIAPQLTFE